MRIQAGLTQLLDYYTSNYRTFGAGRGGCGISSRDVPERLAFSEGRDTVSGARYSKRCDLSSQRTLI